MPRFMVTISPKYRMQDPEVLYQNDKTDIRRHFNKFSKKYTFYPEFDDKSRLHYHGIVEVNDLTKMHKSKYRLDKTLGFTHYQRVKSFKEHLRALLYCMKQWASNCCLFIKPIMYRKLRRIKYEKESPLDDFVGIMKWVTKEK